MSAPGSILIVSFHFSPDPAVGSLRWSGLAKYLARRGWTVHVITAGGGKDPDEGEPGVVVHRVRRRRTLDEAYTAWRAARASERRLEAGKALTEAGGAGKRRVGFLGALRQDLGYVLALPDHSRGWILRAAAKIRSVSRRHSFDFVVTSGPPHGAHLAGAMGSRTVPLVLDLRDPWPYQLQSLKTLDLLPSRLGRWLEPRLAGFTFRSAAAAITNTQEFAREFRRERPELSVHWLPNGIDPERLPGRESATPSPWISHVGSLYAGRDLGPVMRALRLLRDRGGSEALAAGLRLRVAGPMEPDHWERFQRQVESEGVGDRVDILGVLPPVEAAELVRASSLSLVLAQDQPLQVPAKLYESVGLGVPTLALAPRGTATYNEAVRVGARACDPDDVEAIAAAIEAAAADERRDQESPREPIDYDTLAGRLEEILSRIRCGAEGALAPKDPVQEMPRRSGARS